MLEYDSVFNECRELFQKKLGKQFSDFTTREIAYLCDIVHDRIIGRMNLFLRWSTAERECFLNWLKEMNVDYCTLDDSERWAYEDAYSIVE